MLLPVRKGSSDTPPQPTHHHRHPVHLEVVKAESVIHDHDGHFHTEPVAEPTEPADFVCGVDDIPRVADYRLHMPLWILQKRRQVEHDRDSVPVRYVDPYTRYPKLYRRFIEIFDISWCRFFHNDIKWDGGDHYECGSCGKKYAVPYADKDKLGPDVYFKE